MKGCGAVHCSAFEKRSYCVARSVLKLAVLLLQL